MENELITISTKRIDGEEISCISARELHEFLEIGTRFDKWFGRMCEYGINENNDFVRVAQKCPTLGGVQTKIDYIITLDMAKEISMIQRTPKGKQARQYFIQCEKKLKEVVKTPKRINSVELCKIINELRKEEKGDCAKKLTHDNLMKKIRKEVETMKKLGLTGDGNFSLSSYINSQNKEQPCYSLNASGMRQMLNSESTYVRYKTEEYIKKLENENEKLKSQAPQLTKEQELALKIFNGGFTAIEAYKELADIETKPL